tara:strand:+ start:5323 stop:5733 length:411 start_codon:yes stop_codon:yes gene_type:complete
LFIKKQRKSIFSINEAIRFQIIIYYFRKMDFKLENKWRKTIDKISVNFGEKLDIQTILFLIGLQELNLNFEKLTKDQKVEVIHVGLCTVLEPYGYYTKLGIDSEGWPHFENSKKIPNVKEKEQEQIIKEAIIDYFN